jgi:hypothetical protein
MVWLTSECLRPLPQPLARAARFVFAANPPNRPSFRPCQDQNQSQEIRRIPLHRARKKMSGATHSA